MEISYILKIKGSGWMVTIYDVALASGFSSSTVSKAFNAYPGVNKKTMEKILRIANEMGYTPDLNARTLAMKKNDKMKRYT